MAAVLCWVVVVIGCMAGGSTLLTVYSSAQSAPQQAAGAAMAVALTVIPYCFARACFEIIADQRAGRIIKLLEGRKPGTGAGDGQAQRTSLDSGLPISDATQPAPPPAAVAPVQQKAAIPARKKLSLGWIIVGVIAVLLFLLLNISYHHAVPAR